MLDVAHYGNDLADAAQRQLPAGRGDGGTRGSQPQTLTPQARKVLLDSYQVARSLGATHIWPEHVLLALAANQDFEAGRLLGSEGVTPQVLVKGFGLAVISLIAGEVQVSFSTVLSVQPHVKSGKLRALGVSTAKRVQVLPDVPTISESGLPGFATSQWFGILGPARLPRPIVDRLYDSLARASSTPEMKERFAAQGVEVVNGKPEEFAALIRRELKQSGFGILAAGVEDDSDCEMERRPAVIPLPRRFDAAVECCHQQGKCNQRQDAHVNRAK